MRCSAFLALRLICHHQSLLFAATDRKPYAVQCTGGESLLTTHATTFQPFFVHEFFIRRGSLAPTKKSSTSIIGRDGQERKVWCFKVTLKCRTFESPRSIAVVAYPHATRHEVLRGHRALFPGQNKYVLTIAVDDDSWRHSCRTWK